MPETPEIPAPPEPKDLLVNGIVAARDFMPYVQICDGPNILFQLGIAETRKVALDMLQTASRMEADAMLIKFFGKMEFPREASAALMVQFREFRHELDMQPVESGFSPPSEDDDEQRTET